MSYIEEEDLKEDTYYHCLTYNDEDIIVKYYGDGEFSAYLDFINYYNWFLTKRYWVVFNKPLYGAHVSVYYEKFQSDVVWDKAVFYDGKEIEFEYDPYLVEGGFRKGFIMFYAMIFSEELEKLKQKLRIIDFEGYQL